MIELDISDYAEVAKISDRVKKLLSEKSFREYIREKCVKELETITRQNISGFQDNPEYLSQYKQANKSRVDQNSVTLYNASMVDLSNLSEKIKKNYPEGLSLASLIEYGTGVVGARSEASNFAGEAGWSYDVNSHGDKGWIYEKDGRFYHTKGMEGKLIYHKLEAAVKEKIGGWTADYIKTNLKRR